MKQNDRSVEMVQERPVCQVCPPPGGFLFVRRPDIAAINAHGNRAIRRRLLFPFFGLALEETELTLLSQLLLPPSGGHLGERNQRKPTWSPRTATRDWFAPGAMTVAGRNVFGPLPWHRQGAAVPETRDQSSTVRRIRLGRVSGPMSRERRWGRRSTGSVLYLTRSDSFPSPRDAALGKSHSRMVCQPGRAGQSPRARWRALASGIGRTRLAQ